MKILHLTDIHPTDSDPPDKDGARSARRTAAMVRDIRSRASGDLQNSIIVISGDLMDERTTENVAFARAQIAELRKDFVVIVCPGNHDYYDGKRKADPSLGRDFWREFMLPMKSQKSPVTWKTPETEVDYPVRLDVGADLTFLILDSSADSMGEKTLGRLGMDQRDKLVQRFGEVSPGRKLVVIIHHDPIFTGIMKVGKAINRDPRLIEIDCEVLKSAMLLRPADLLLCGHTHNPRVYAGSILNDWSLRMASNGGTSAGHKTIGSLRSKSPHLLFDLEGMQSPKELKLIWK